MEDEELKIPEEPPDMPIQETNVKGIVHLEEAEKEEPENENDQ